MTPTDRDSVPKKLKRVTFQFDERSAVGLESLMARGFKFTRINLYDPKTCISRELDVPWHPDINNFPAPSPPAPDASELRRAAQQLHDRVKGCVAS